MKRWQAWGRQEWLRASARKANALVRKNFSWGTGECGRTAVSLAGNGEKGERGEKGEKEKKGKGQGGREEGKGESFTWAGRKKSIPFSSNYFFLKIDTYIYLNS